MAESRTYILILVLITNLFFFSGCTGVFDSLRQIDSGDSKTPIDLEYELSYEVKGSIATKEIGSTDIFEINIRNTGKDLNGFEIDINSDTSELISSDCPSTFLNGASCSIQVKIVYSSITNDEPNAMIKNQTLSLQNIVIPISATPKVLNVNSVYPVFGSNWNDYVKHSDSQKDRFEQPDTDCSGGGTYANCIHGGEIKSVELGEIKTCSGYSMEDSLGAFKWKCYVKNGKAVFYSLGLNEGKNLSDLVNATSWKTLFVTAKKGSEQVSLNNVLSLAHSSFDIYLYTNTTPITKVAVSYLLDFFSTSTIDDSFIFSPDVLSKGFNCARNMAAFDSNCDPTGSSTATVNKNVSFFSDIVGKIIIEDFANSSDTNGTATHPGLSLTFDWNHFDNPYRVWGKSSSNNWSDAGNLGSCTSSTCGIWDLALSTSGNKIKNTSNNGSSTNQSFIPGEQCPHSVNGNRTRLSSLNETFLINAGEIIGDNIGNDNGLCESNEACIYHPNFGAYQGHGDYYSMSPCVFIDGTVTGVTMYAYPINGF